MTFYTRTTGYTDTVTQTGGYTCVDKGQRTYKRW